MSEKITFASNKENIKNTEKVPVGFNDLVLPEEDKELIRGACQNIYSELAQESVWVKRVPTRFEVLSLENEEENEKLACQITIKFHMGHPHWQHRFELENGSFTVSDEVKENLKKTCEQYGELDSG